MKTLAVRTALTIGASILIDLPEPSGTLVWLLVKVGRSSPPPLLRSMTSGVFLQRHGGVIFYNLQRATANVPRWMVMVSLVVAVICRL